jgi:hypothetical protein
MVLWYNECCCFHFYSGNVPQKGFYNDFNVFYIHPLFQTHPPAFFTERRGDCRDLVNRKDIDAVDFTDSPPSLAFAV